MVARTLTFLMTDVQGSTRLWEELPALMPDVMRRQEEIIQRAVADNGGRLIKSKGEGDSTFSVFENPSGAVRAALTAQSDLAGEVWPNGVALKVRMGLHTGEAHPRGDDFFGATINRCARIREIGHGGQILVSRAVRELAVSGVEAVWSDHGMHRLRDLLRPEHIWQIDPVQTLAAFPRLKSLSVSRNNLPVQLTSFIGREVELGRLKGLVERNRLVTVVGFGGEGKTRMVLQAGAEIDAEGSTNVWFVALDSLRTAQQVSAAIIGVLGGDAEMELTSENLEKLGLRSSQTLMILDNAEHLLAAVRPIAELLLREASQLYLLISSRQPIRAAGETLFRIPGMSVAPEEDPSLPALEASEAGQLFLTRASSRESDFRATEASAKPIGEICRRLEGIPLAVEQAAALVSIMSPAQILERLKSKLDWLATEDADVPDRHRTLNATIQWSYELLSENGQKLFLMLSIFRASFTMDAAVFMAESLVEGEMAATFLVRDLVDKSFVTRIYEEEEEVRFRLLEPLRQFAHARLGPAPDDWMSRYVDWHVRFASEFDAGFDGADQSSWVERAQLEHSNFRRALEWSGEKSDSRLVKVAFDLRKYWLRRGLYTEGRSWLDRALEMTSDRASLEFGALANTLGAFAFRQYDYESALHFYQTAQINFESAGERQLLLGTYNNIAITLDPLGRSSEAGDYFRRSIDICRDIEDWPRLVILLLNYAIGQRSLGFLDEAESATREALTITETHRLSSDVHRIYLCLCTIEVERECFDHASRWALSALDKGGSRWHPGQLAQLLSCAGAIAAAQGFDESAIKLVAGAESLLQPLGGAEESTFLRRRRKVELSISARASETEVALWKAYGRASTEEQLAAEARKTCEAALGSANNAAKPSDHGAKSGLLH